jgi:hypothetical protein
MYMRKIEFDHTYLKLFKVDRSEPATLLDVIETNTKDLSAELLDYDTTYYWDGSKRNRALDINMNCLLLIFVSGNNVMFTSIIRDNKENRDLYMGSIGKDFAVDIVD